MNSEKANHDQPWKDAELVNRLYHKEGMSGPEIAEELGCSVGPIYDRIENTRSFGEANKIWRLREPPQFTTTESGYERVRTKIDGDVYSTAIHRLIAVAEWGADAVSGKVVHHKNGIPWDNRVSNLEVMQQSRHVREHLEQISPNAKAEIHRLSKETDHTHREIADVFGLPRSTVNSIVARIDRGDYHV